MPYRLTLDGPVIGVGGGSVRCDSGKGVGPSCAFGSQRGVECAHFVSLVCS